MTFAEWLLRAVGELRERDKFVRVISWRPSWSGDPLWRGIEWPVYIVDRGGVRWTRKPLWTLTRLLGGYEPRAGKIRRHGARDRNSGK